MTNSAPYKQFSISNRIVGVDGEIMIDPSNNFRDKDDHWLTINDAYYTLDSITSPIPGSFFSFDNTRRKILVDPTPTS